MRKISMVGMVLLIGWTATVRARLGETEAEIQKRYGKPIPDGGTVTTGLIPADKTQVYRFESLMVGVWFVDGKSAVEQFQHEWPAVGLPDKLSELEIKVLLAANAATSHWDSVKSSDPHTSSWKRADGRAVANYDQERRALFIVTDNRTSKQRAEDDSKQ